MEEIAKSSEDNRRISLCELLERVLNKGAVLVGEICVSVAGVELLYIAVNVLVSSVETLIEAMDIGVPDESEGAD